MVHGQFREEPPQASSHIIRIESNLVIVPLHVSKKGTAVTGLGPEAFEVFEDGRRQEIAFVEGPGTQDARVYNRGSVPKEIIFLIDVSLSVSRWRLLDDETIREGILDALTEDFRVSIYGFGSTIRQYAGPTRDPALLARALRQLSMSRKAAAVYTNLSCIRFCTRWREGAMREGDCSFSRTDWTPPASTRIVRCKPLCPRRLPSIPLW